MEDVEIGYEFSTFVRRVQWVTKTREMRIAIANAGRPLQWYGYSRVPRPIFDELRVQVHGASRQGTGHEKGDKPYSVGTYFMRHMKGKFDEVPVDGPWGVH
jgi:hypothetical protein